MRAARTQKSIRLVARDGKLLSEGQEGPLSSDRYEPLPYSFFPDELPGGGLGRMAPSSPIAFVCYLLLAATILVVLYFS